MKYLNLEATREESFGIDLVEWPSITGLLIHLEKHANIVVLSRTLFTLKDRPDAEFCYQGSLFRIETLISSPCLLSGNSCKKEVFESLLEYVRSYRRQSVIGILVWHIKFLMSSPSVHQ